MAKEKEKKNAKRASAFDDAGKDEAAASKSPTSKSPAPKISDLQAEAIFSARENVRRWERVVDATKNQLKEEKGHLESAQADLGNLIDVAAGVVRPEDTDGPLFNGQGGPDGIALGKVYGQAFGAEVDRAAIEALDGEAES